MARDIYAFPRVPTNSHDVVPGMTLRDYFAAHLVAGLYEDFDHKFHGSAAMLAAFAYEMADAMLAERKVQR